MVGGFALWAFLMFTAYQGKTTRLPDDRRVGSQTSRNITTTVTQRKLLMKTLLSTLLTATLLLPPCALADVTYQETTEITGGSIDGDGQNGGRLQLLRPSRPLRPPHPLS